MELAAVYFGRERENVTEKILQQTHERNALTGDQKREKLLTFESLENVSSSQN
jgi:hypothetical protein